MQHLFDPTCRRLLSRRSLAACLFGFACTLLLPLAGQAAQATFQWDYSAAGAAGFMLYCGPFSGTSSTVKYTIVLDAGDTRTYTIVGLRAGDVYQCAVAAYDARRSQSDYSAPVRIYVAAAGRCERACDSDLNDDGQINALDLGEMRKGWSTSDRLTDFNGDGIVDALDLGIFSVLYQ